MFDDDDFERDEWHAYDHEDAIRAEDDAIDQLLAVNGMRRMTYADRLPFE